MTDPAIISVENVLRDRSIAELNASADDYFRHVHRNALMQKPFNDPSETAEIVLTLMHVIKGLRLAPGATVLDFGAGSCWSSSILAGFGYKVIASDVSQVALDIGRELLRRKPILVDHIPIEFLPFNGCHLDLPDASIDAICCLSALHHVPNPDSVLKEMARVLRPWGRAGFSEPGPTHSLSPQSQDEMRNFCVLENDVNLDDIWKVAKEVGFNTLRACLFYPEPVYLPLDEFKRFLDGQPSAVFDQNMRLLMANRRLFIMEKGSVGVGTSMLRDGLEADVTTDPESIFCLPRATFGIDVALRNTGSALWRPSDDDSGPVRLGPGWVQSDDSIDYLPRVFLPLSNLYGILPNEEVSFKVEIVAPAVKGTYCLRLQLVAEVVAWFGTSVDVTVNVI